MISCTMHMLQVSLCTHQIDAMIKIKFMEICWHNFKVSPTKPSPEKKQKDCQNPVKVDWQQLTPVSAQ